MQKLETNDEALFALFHGGQLGKLMKELAIEVTKMSVSERKLSGVELTDNDLKVVRDKAVRVILETYYYGGYYDAALREEVKQSGSD